MTKELRMEPGKGTQGDKILRYLERGRKLTAIKALEIAGSMKCATRIGELREAGFKIESEWVTTNTGKRVKQYFMKK